MFTLDFFYFKCITNSIWNKKSYINNFSNLTFNFFSWKTHSHAELLLVRKKIFFFVPFQNYINVFFSAATKTKSIRDENLLFYLIKNRKKRRSKVMTFYCDFCFSYTLKLFKTHFLCNNTYLKEEFNSICFSSLLFFEWT